MAHIARRELLEDNPIPYRNAISIITDGRTTTAKDLTIEELEMLIAVFVKAGWRPGAGKQQSQLFMLRERAKELSLEIVHGSKRLPGLCRKICGVDHLEWCRDAGQLKHLLAAMTSIRDREQEK